MHCGIELDAFTVGQTEHFVVIKHCVHVLNPEGVHRAITDNPLVVLSGVLQQTQEEGEKSDRGGRARCGDGTVVRKSVGREGQRAKQREKGKKDRAGRGRE